MIIQENESNVTMFGQMETIEFEIKTDDAKMFHILSNLYSDPLGAVVREISTNCCDGHKIKGNVEVPFDIILPGYMDMGNFISFRDYGPGMSHQNIKDIYTKFGQSTKVNSNDQTGCLGLGSKSPLAITSSFTVTSVCDGVKTVYSISKDNHGKPNLSVFGQSESQEENGLMVTVPLTGQYVDKVVDTIKDELKYFKVKPRIMKGSSEDEKFKWNNQFENFFELITDVFYITKRETSTESTIIQGEIGYSFSSETLMKMISVDEELEDFLISDKMKVNEKTFKLLKDFYKEFGMKLFSDMGTISFAPNREELIYDTLTSKNLIRSTIQAIQLIRKIYNDSYSYVRNPFDYESIGSGYNYLKTDNDFYKKFISRFGFKFSKIFGVTNFILSDGSSPFKDGISNINRYQYFDNIEQITSMRKKGFEDGFLVKKQIKTERGYSSGYRSCNSLKEICGSNQDNFHIVFINDSRDYKFAKKHLANYYQYFNESHMQILIVELRHLSPVRIDEFIRESGLTKNSHIPFADVLAISEYQIAQEKLLNPTKEITKAPSREVILKRKVLRKLPSKIENFEKFYTTTTAIKEELVGIYITTFNNDIVYSDRVKNEFPEIYNLYSNNNASSFSNIMQLLNCMGEVSESKMDTMVYVGNEKLFNKTKLVHFEDFLLQHIKSIKLLNSLSQTKEFNLIPNIERDNIKILEMLEVYDLTIIGPVQRELQDFRNYLQVNLAPLREWFYDKNTKFLQAYDTWQLYRNNSGAADIFKQFYLLDSYNSNKTKLEYLKKEFNINVTIHNINSILNSHFLGQYSEKFIDIRRYSNVLNSYMTNNEEIKKILIVLEDINTVDYIRINVKGINNIPKLPIHTCEEPPPPTEEEIANAIKEKEMIRLRKENELRDLYLEEKFNFEYQEDILELVAE